MTPFSRASSSPEEIEDPDAEADSGNDQEEPVKNRHLIVNDDGMLLRDNLFGTPEEDAWRRDFTRGYVLVNPVTHAVEIHSNP